MILTPLDLAPQEECAACGDACGGDTHRKRVSTETDNTQTQWYQNASIGNVVSPQQESLCERLPRMRGSSRQEPQNSPCCSCAYPCLQNFFDFCEEREPLNLFSNFATKT